MCARQASHAAASRGAGLAGLRNAAVEGPDGPRVRTPDKACLDRPRLATATHWQRAPQRAQLGIASSRPYVFHAERPAVSFPVETCATR